MIRFWGIMDDIKVCSLENRQVNDKGDSCKSQ